jgi:hypothetical protein
MDRETEPRVPPSGTRSPHRAGMPRPSSRTSAVSTGAAAGLIAGIAFVVAQMALVWLVDGQSPWAPPHLIAAMVLGPEILPPADFSLPATLVALAIHLPLAALYGIAIGALVSHFTLGPALGAGMLAGIAIYGLHFRLVVPSLFPWFVDARGPVTLFTHALFGMVAAGLYVTMRRA